MYSHLENFTYILYIRDEISLQPAVIFWTQFSFLMCPNFTDNLLWKVIYFISVSVSLIGRFWDYLFWIEGFTVTVSFLSFLTVN